MESKTQDENLKIILNYASNKKFYICTRNINFSPCYLIVPEMPYKDFNLYKTVQTSK